MAPPLPPRCAVARGATHVAAVETATIAAVVIVYMCTSQKVARSAACVCDEPVHFAVVVSAW